MLHTRGAGCMPDHRDKPAGAMAHGPAKCSDVERVREEVGEADARSVRAEELSLERHRQRVARPRARAHESSHLGRSDGPARLEMRAPGGARRVGSRRGHSCLEPTLTAGDPGDRTRASVSRRGTRSRWEWTQRRDWTSRGCSRPSRTHRRSPRPMSSPIASRTRSAPPRSRSSSPTSAAGRSSGSDMPPARRAAARRGARPPSACRWSAARTAAHWPTSRSRWRPRRMAPACSRP